MLLFAVVITRWWGGNLRKRREPCSLGGHSSNFVLPQNSFYLGALQSWKREVALRWISSDFVGGCNQRRRSEITWLGYCNHACCRQAGHANPLRQVNVHEDFAVAGPDRIKRDKCFRRRSIKLLEPARSCLYGHLKFRIRIQTNLTLNPNLKTIVSMTTNFDPMGIAIKGICVNQRGKDT